MFWHLSIIPPTDPLGKFDWHMIRRLQKAPGQRLDRRALKRTFQRPGAWHVDYTIARLIGADRITERDSLLYPFSKAELQARIEAQSRPRRPVPVSTIY